MNSINNDKYSSSNNYNNNIDNNANNNTCKNINKTTNNIHNSNKPHTIQFRMKDPIYSIINEKASEQNLSANMYVRQLLISSLNGSTGLTPEMICLLSGLYDMLKTPQREWNHEMHNNFKKGLKKLYDSLQGNK